MGRSLLTASSSAMVGASGFDDAFRFLAFDQGTGEILAYGHKAAFALARADLREPHKAIEILNAGVAGRDLWKNQTPLALARMVVDMLADPSNWDSQYGGIRPAQPKLRI